MSLRGRQNSTTRSLQTAGFLVVRLGLSYLALPATGVRGVLTSEEAGHERTVTAAGSVSQQVDLAQQLSIVADLSGPEMRTVLYSTGRSQGAMAVEQVVGLIDVEPNECLPLPAQFRGDERNWFGGMMLYQDRLVLILNPSWALGELSRAESVPRGQIEQPMGATPVTFGESC
jgi:chemotaxis signal transduction protein